MLSILIISFAFIATPVFGAETTSQKAVVWLPIAKANVLLGKDYFAACIKNPQQAKKLLDYISKIELRPQPPIQPQDPQGLKLPVGLITSPPKPLLFELFTSHSEKAFDLYLYLAKKAQSQHSITIKINYQEFAQALGYIKNYYFNLFQPLRKLTRKYGLIQHKPSDCEARSDRDAVPEVRQGRIGDSEDKYNFS